MSILRDILRRKGRSALTVGGIAIGIFALVVLGALSENLSVYIDNATAYFEDKLMVMDVEESGPLGIPSGSRPLTAEQIDAVACQPGVRACLPLVSMLLDESVTSVGMSAPPMIMGLAPGYERYERWGVSKGRRIRGDEHGVSMVGQDFATRQNVDVGDSVDVRGESLEVVGIVERTFISLNDASVYVPIDDARDFYADSLPAEFREVARGKDLTVMAVAYVEPGADPTEVTKAVEGAVKGVKTLDQERMFSEMDSYLSVFNAVLAAAAGLGLVVGGLTIVNTMMMAVSERTREIGVRRALGASRWRVARDVLTESAVLAVLGGFGGVALGAAASVVIGGAVTSATGVTMFMLTWRLVLFAVAFAAILGTLSGLYPAWHASRMDPVEALAHE